MFFIHKMETMSHDEPGGNTKTPGKPCGNQCFRWQFTLKGTRSEPNAPDILVTIDPKEIFDNLLPFCKEFYYQLEEGEDGYLHYQGCLSLIVKHRLSEVKNILGWNNVHLEQAMDWHALKKYSTKKDTRMRGPWSHESKWIWTMDMDDFEEWQKEIYCMISKPNDDWRHIYWYWEPTGDVGKTNFVKWCIVHLGANYVSGGSSKNIFHSLPEFPEIILCHFPKSFQYQIPWGALEECKDGLIFSGKYESKPKVFNRPHVIVFANFPPHNPDGCNMSVDKFVVRDIRDYYK